MQGLGLFTLEELKFSPSGLLYTRGPSQYKIPAVCDVPLCFNVHLLSDSYNPPTIYSSKVRGHDFQTQSKPLIVQLEMKLFSYGCLVLQGIGEPTLFLGSSVFFSIRDAVAAARSESGLDGPFSLDSPATPERVCLACASPFAQMVKPIWSCFYFPQQPETDSSYF